ncbi:MAG TPA: menaquinone biosynthesis protein, partial [archaeon]|nr:menaquinone biosynthesis protein [archaeon]
MKEKVLRIGEIPYTNCYNIYYYLKRKYPVPGVEYLSGTPARLNALLRSSAIDLCLSSSIEYARGAGKYLLLPGFCIGSRGPVQSIRLFSSLPIEKLNGSRIVLTDESATSVILCRIILSRFLGCSNQFTTRKADLEEALRISDAVLLIGDRALAAGTRAKNLYIYELNTIWQEHTGFPFVFALWTLRAEAVKETGEILKAFWRSLKKVHREIEKPDEELIRTVLAEKPFFTRQRLLEYWSYICWELSESHLRGLELFYRLAHESGYLPGSPEIK